MATEKNIKFMVESPQKTVLQILEFHRQQFPFEEGEDSANHGRYYWLSGFLNAFLEQQK